MMKYYDVKYEDIIENPETEIKKLLKFCDVEFEERLFKIL